ncbi:hypothetical protein BPA01_55440 [Brevibacillus parabrevis]|jgi:hypothetical protein|uniref:Uncharacterized protein n=1 Tax=Brevibacillus parabrevis TaxID=54914 RepID=A0A4Y3PRF2_BREPA|nr:hypothetical protein BPA01_55440 [Brevibacillus parabrevis]
MFEDGAAFGPQELPYNHNLSAIFLDQANGPGTVTFSNARSSDPAVGNPRIQHGAMNVSLIVDKVGVGETTVSFDYTDITGVTRTHSWVFKFN